MKVHRAWDWLYFGYSKEKIRDLSAFLAAGNLRELHGYCGALIVFWVIAMAVKGYAEGLNWQNTLPFLLEIAVQVILLLLTCRPVSAEKRAVNRSRWLTSVFTVSVYLLTIFYEILFPHHNLHVMICLSFVVLNALFDGYPLETIAMTAAVLAVVVTLDWFLIPHKWFVRNLLNCTVSAFVGCYLAWRRSHEKCRLLIHKEAEQAAHDKELRTQLMLTQLRPHFIYNTLATIRALCAIEPAKAQTAIDQLCDVLRGNMESVSNSKLEPFPWSLERVKNYIALEQLRFGDKLRVEYDLQVTDFLLPPLSLQPIVENAIRHGVGNKRGGGTITIASREEAGFVIVTVTDDGAGIDAPNLAALPKPNDHRTHIGLHNVNERLSLLMGGTLTFHSQAGHGTVVTLRIPKEVRS